MYDKEAFPDKGRIKIQNVSEVDRIMLPIITQSSVDTVRYVFVTENRLVIYKTTITTISSCQVLVTSTHPFALNIDVNKETIF